MEGVLNEAVSDCTSKDFSKFTNDQIDELLDSQNFLVSSKTKIGKLLKFVIGDKMAPTIPAVIKNWYPYINYEYKKKEGTFIKFISRSLFRYDMRFEGIDYESTKKYGILFIKIKPDFNGSIITFHDLKQDNSRYGSGRYFEKDNGKVFINDEENSIISIGLMYSTNLDGVIGASFFKYLEDNLKDVSAAKDFDFYANLILEYLKSKELITKGSSTNSVITISRFDILRREYYNYKIYKELLEKLEKVVDEYKEYALVDRKIMEDKKDVELSEKKFKEILKPHFDIDFDDFIKEHSGTKDLNDSGLF